MTYGQWECIRCGYITNCFISSVILECPECKAQYELVKMIQAHPIHEIPIYMEKETGKLSTNLPTALLLNTQNPEDVYEYSKIVDKMKRYKKVRKE